MIAHTYTGEPINAALNENTQFTANLIYSILCRDIERYILGMKKEVIEKLGEFEQEIIEQSYTVVVFESKYFKRHQ